MGIINDNPVLSRELRARLRLKTLRSNKTLAVMTGLGLLVIVWFYVKSLVGISHGQPQDARDLWGFLLMFLLLIIIVITPALLSTSITREREQQTWEALATTRLSGAQVLLGKWLGRLMMTLLPIVILLPFLVGCAAKGGLPAAAIAAAVLFLAVTASGYGVLGLLCSFLIRKSVTATVTALAVTLLICVGTPVITALTVEFAAASSANYTNDGPTAQWINPFYTLNSLNSALEPGAMNVMSGSSEGPGGAVVVFYLIATTLFAGSGLFFMVARYRRAARE